MIYVALPVGRMYGWGTCGRYLPRHLASLMAGQVKLIAKQLDPKMVENESELHDLARLLLEQQELAKFSAADGVMRLDGPLLTCVGDTQTLMPRWPGGRGTRTVGYTFFEDNILSPAAID